MGGGCGISRGNEGEVGFGGGAAYNSTVRCGGDCREGSSPCCEVEGQIPEHVRGCLQFLEGEKGVQRCGDVPLKQQEVKLLANMKSMHFFVANGGQSIRINPLSCYCVKCEEYLFDECERVERGERKADIVHNTLGYDPNTRMLHEGRLDGLLNPYDFAALTMWEKCSTHNATCG